MFAMRHYSMAASLFAIFVLSSLILAQGSHQLTKQTLSNAPISLDWSFRKDVQEVYLLFSATLHGKFVSDLGADDVSVLDDGSIPEKVTAFYTQRDIPLRVGFIVDTSPSVNARFKFEQKAATEFLTEIVRSHRDEAFVIGVADFPRLVQELTSNTGELRRAVGSLVDQGDSTSLLDAVVQGCQEFSKHPEQQFVARTIVVVSDGEDNSSLATLSRATLLAQESNVTIYAISASSSVHYRSSGDQILKTLAEETGGRALFPGSPKNFRSAFGHIAQELSSRYAISYRPAHFALDGRYRRIQIHAKSSGKKLKVYARKGYYAALRIE